MHSLQVEVELVLFYALLLKMDMGGQDDYNAAIFGPVISWVLCLPGPSATLARRRRAVCVEEHVSFVACARTQHAGTHNVRRALSLAWGQL